MHIAIIGAQSNKLSSSVTQPSGKVRSNIWTEYSQDFRIAP
jgi:hypothetical protein